MSFSDLVDKKLKEEAKSKSQRRLMGWARACEKGEADDCPERVKNVAKSFKDKAELKKYAKTKEKGLPEKVDEAYGYRPTSRDDADEYGDWKMHQRQDQELDRRWEEEQAKKKDQDVDEGEAYGAEKWDDYEGDTGVEDEMIAWTGGSAPPKYADMDIRTKKLVRQAYKQQVGEYTSGWGEEPDEDTKQIFWNRAMHDAWASTRGQNEEDMTWADLDQENVLSEKAKQGTSAPLAVSPGEAGPDKEWTPRFEPQPKDAGAPTWHEPKARWETIKHRDSLRGVINVGTRPEMKNKAYRNGEHNNPKMSTVVYDESRKIRVNHPTKGNGTVTKIFEGAVVIEWDSLNLRPLGPETLSKEEAQYVTVIENYAKSADEAEMEPKAKKKKDKEEVEEGDVVQLGGEQVSPDLLTVQQLRVLRNRFNNIERIDPAQPAYQGLVEFLDNASDEVIKQLAGAYPPIKFLTKLAHNRMLKRGLHLQEDQYEQQPSFQVAPPPAMTIFQDQETDEDWSADPLATQRGADAAGDGDAPEGEMEEPDDAPDDLNIDHQELPDSGRAEQIAGEVFQAFDGEGGSRNEIDYKSDQVDFEKQSDSSHNKEDGGESDSEDSDSEDSGSEKKQAFPARDKSEDKDDDSEEKETERDDSESDEDSDEEKKKADESLSLKDFDIEGILE